MSRTAGKSVPGQLTPIVTVAHQARPGHTSQDRHLILINAVAVLDGATNPDFPPDRDAGWYADQLTAAIAARLHLPNFTLAEVLEASIAGVADTHRLRIGSSPSSTVTMIRWANSEAAIEALVLADTTLVVRDLNGTTHVYCDNRIDRYAARPIDAYQARLATGGGYDAEHTRLMHDLGTFLSLGRNRPGGFWVAEADPQAARQALAVSLDARRVRDAAILTDGAAACVDLYRVLPDWTAALDLMDADGPAALVEVVRDAEAADPDGQRWPRPKPHDDATAVYVDLCSRSR